MFRSVTVSSKLVKVCMTTLLMLLSDFHIKLVWVPGQSGIVRYFKGDELIRKGSLTQFVKVSGRKMK